MTIVSDAVSAMEKKLEGSGCDHGVVTLEEKPDGEICPYLSGKCLEAAYGGKRVSLATAYPIEAKTKVSFMYGEALNSPRQRTAACAILNSLSKFMCFTRISGPCPEGCMGDCLEELREEIGGRRIYLNGIMPGLEGEFGEILVSSPDEADVILVSGDGLFSDEGVLICDRFTGEKEMIYLAPATSGLAGTLGLRHWCPYGRK